MSTRSNFTTINLYFTISCVKKPDEDFKSLFLFCYDLLVIDSFSNSYFLVVAEVGTFSIKQVKMGRISCNTSRFLKAHLKAAALGERVFRCNNGPQTCTNIHRTLRTRYVVFILI